MSDYGKKLLPKAEKGLEDFKIYFGIAGLLTVIYEAVFIIEATGKQGENRIPAAVMAGSLPMLVCIICFLYCAFRYKRMRSRRRFLYENGVRVQGKVEKILRSRSNKRRTRYMVLVSYAYNGRIKYWKSPAYEDDVTPFFVHGGSCNLYVYKNKVCLDERQPQAKQYGFDKLNNNNFFSDF